ncbi:caspase family protein [Boseaceae bacterium BT-24-1]|nr:caspase family protein [Boseaceae bacterium BT-24-1]
MSTIRLAAVLLAAFLATLIGTLAKANPNSDRRVALVIGNSTYKTVPALPNTENDATDVAAALRANGFEVIEGRNLDRRGMGEALGRFARAADGAEAALFYYAGHGLQFRGENYLVSTDSAPSDEFGIPFETTRVADVIEALGHAVGTRILILDACRNNPLADRLARNNRTRDIGANRGLARINQSQGMVVAYATQANDVAADGIGRNSPFTSAFVEQLREPGLEVGQLFRRVAVEVNKKTGGRQTPELAISLLGDFYFNRSESDVQAWARVRDSSAPLEFRSFLERYPRSLLADAAKARLDIVERGEREEALRQQIAKYEEERGKAAASLDAARKIEAARAAAEGAAQTALAAQQAEAKRKAEDEATRQQAEQKRRYEERLAQLEIENRKAQAELAVRAAEQAKRARDDKDREHQLAERDRLAAAQNARMNAAEADARRQRQDEEHRIAERLAKLEDENRRAAAELAARHKAEDALRETAEREKAKLIGELEAERRRATEELQRIQRDGANDAKATASQQGIRIANAAADTLTAPASQAVLVPDIASLTRSVNIELTRIGCYQGKLDAAWTSKPTSRAAREFARLANISPPAAPSVEFLEALKRQAGRVCPLVCASNQIERNGTCAAKPRQVVQERASRPAATRAAPAAPARAPRGRCFNFNGQAFCE